MRTWGKKHNGNSLQDQTERTHSRVEWYNTFLQFSKTGTMLLIRDPIKKKSANLAKVITFKKWQTLILKVFKIFFLFSYTFNLLQRTIAKKWEKKIENNSKKLNKKMLGFQNGWICFWPWILDLGSLNNLAQLAECLFSSSKITPP